MVNHVDHVTIEVNGVIDGNGPNQTGGNCINVFNDFSNFWLIGHGTIQNCMRSAVTVWNPPKKTAAAHARIYDITVKNTGTASQCNRVDDCWFDHVTSIGVTDYSISMYGGVTNSGIINSSSSHGTASGFNVLQDKAQPDPSYNILIANNIAHHNAAGCVDILNYLSAPGSSHVLINGNVCHENNTAGGAFRWHKCRPRL